MSLSICQSLAHRTIFLTGVTGFLGKLVLEKILRSCPLVETIFVLIRSRKESSASQRLHTEVFQSRVFSRLEKEIGASALHERLTTKVIPLAGELTEPHLGLSVEAQTMIRTKTHIFIHCAAIVDFNERLDRALEMNTCGTLKLLDLAKQCSPPLAAFIHVSTCYVHSNKHGKDKIKEMLYPLGFDPTMMMQQIQAMNEKELSEIKFPGSLGDWPNTYTFTKAITEHLLEQRRGDIPLSIVRPSIIGCCWQDPMPGWVDVVSAAGAGILSIGMGLLKIIPGSESYVADVIPADYVVHAILLAIPQTQQSSSMQIFQAASSTEHCMYWKDARHAIAFFETHPPLQRVGPPSFRMIQSPLLFDVEQYFRYTLPLLLVTRAKKLVTVQKVLQKAHTIMDVFRHFTEHEWFFCNHQVREASLKLVPEEQTIFPTQQLLASITWSVYNRVFAYGLSKFMLKMPLIELSECPHTSLLSTEKKTLYTLTKPFPWDKLYLAVLKSPSNQAKLNTHVLSSTFTRDTLKDVEHAARFQMEQQTGETHRLFQLRVETRWTSIQMPTLQLHSIPSVKDHALCFVVSSSPLLDLPGVCSLLSRLCQAWQLPLPIWIHDKSMSPFNGHRQLSMGEGDEWMIECVKQLVHFGVPLGFHLSARLLETLQTLDKPLMIVPLQMQMYTTGQAHLSVAPPLLTEPGQRFSSHVLVSQVRRVQVTSGMIHPIHLVGTLLSMYPFGLAKQQLVELFGWLRECLMERHALCVGFETWTPLFLVEQSLGQLPSDLFQPRKQIYQVPRATSLYGYREPLLSLFFMEACWACAFYACTKYEQTETEDILLSVVSAKVDFLVRLFAKEEYLSPSVKGPGSSLFLLRRLSNEQTKISLHPSAEPLFVFLCALLWPFVDAYYISLTVLSSSLSVPPHSISRLDVQQKINWVSRTMYSMTIVSSHPLDVFDEWGIIQSSAHQITLSSQSRMQTLIDQIGALRNVSSSIRLSGDRSTLCTEVPMLAKL